MGNKNEVDGDVIQYYDQSGAFIRCTVCPKSNGSYRFMKRKYLRSHINSELHKRHVRRHMQSKRCISDSHQHTTSTFPSFSLPLQPSGDVEDSFQFTEEDIPITHLPFEVDADANPRAPNPGTESADDNQPIPLSDLWKTVYNDRYREIGAKYNDWDNDTSDLFQELQDILTSGELTFLTATSPSTSPCNDIGMELEGTEASDFGICLPDDDQVPLSRSTKTPVSPTSPMYPWPSKEHFLTELLFSSPRLPFSETQKKAILSWAKELGVCNVPSLFALNRRYEDVRTLIGDPTRKVVSLSGNVFYINDVANAIALDYANPLTRFSMQDYPEDGGNGMSQAFHGSKMLLEQPSPPAVQVDGNIYFVDEILQDCTGGYFFPERFFYATPSVAEGTPPSSNKDEKDLFALGRAAKRTDAGFIVSDEKLIIPTSSFQRSYEDIAFHSSELACGLTESSQKYVSLSANPWRKKSGGRMVYAVPLIIFMDDVSGNISKQWNKHHVIYMSNANLPREMLDQQFFIRFVASSPHAAPMELMRAMKESIEQAAESGVIAWDCRHQAEVMLAPYGLFHAGDNPMHAEECSQAGLSCNYFCRTCEVGGTKEYKESDKGYCSMFQPGSLRTPEKTVNTIKEQFASAVLSGATEKVRTSVSTTGVRDSVTQGILNTIVEMGKKLRKRTAGATPLPEAQVVAALEKELADLLAGVSLEDAINPLLGMKGLNIHLDTPTEILHTILLGIVKYFWGQTVYLLEKAKLLDVFQSRLDSINRDALNLPSLNAEYVCHYRSSLIGKHFKSLAQVMPFVIHGLVPSTVIDGWSAIGELVVLLWHTKIEDIEVYLARLSRVIEDFLNITAICAPSILISKPKFHFLVHLPLYIRRFGPAILFSTERYESFNHVFRLTCIHSTQIGPSQDSCRRLARVDCVKHILTGGFWYEPSLQKWVHAGSAVLDFLETHPEHAKLLGINIGDDESESVGQILRIPASRGAQNKSETSGAVHWEKTQTAKINPLIIRPPDGMWFYQGESFQVISNNGEKLKLGGDAIFVDEGSPAGFSVGRIIEILIPSTSSKHEVQHVALQRFAFDSTLHPSLRVPTLELTEERVAVGFNDIVCAVNIQHNCLDSKCSRLDKEAVRQERIETKRFKSVVSHEPTPKYLLNTFSIHNYAQIHAALPSPLREIPIRAGGNVSEIRIRAAGQIRQKKAQKKLPPGEMATSAPCTPAVFDRPSRQTKGATARQGAKAQPTPLRNSAVMPPSQDPSAGTLESRSLNPVPAQTAARTPVSQSFHSASTFQPALGNDEPPQLQARAFRHEGSAPPLSAQPYCHIASSITNIPPATHLIHQPHLIPSQMQPGQFSPQYHAPALPSSQSHSHNLMTDVWAPSPAHLPPGHGLPLQTQPEYSQIGSQYHVPPQSPYGEIRPVYTTAIQQHSMSHFPSLRDQQHHQDDVYHVNSHPPPGPSSLAIMNSHGPTQHELYDAYLSPDRSFFSAPITSGAGFHNHSAAQHGRPLLYTSIPYYSQ